MKREILIDGQGMTTPDHFHQQMAQLFDFPSYYGGNLDDLWTCLTTYINPHIKLTIQNYHQIRNVFGSEVMALDEIFHRLPQTCPEMEILIVP